MFGFIFGFLMFLFVVVSLLLILIVLIQKGRGGGLASAFGGASGHTAFGAKTGDVLTWATSIIFGVFLLLAVILNLMANAKNAAAQGQQAQQQQPVAPAPPAGGGQQ